MRKIEKKMLAQLDYNIRYTRRDNYVNICENTFVEGYKVTSYSTPIFEFMPCPRTYEFNLICTRKSATTMSRVRALFTYINEQHGSNLYVRVSKGNLQIGDSGKWEKLVSEPFIKEFKDFTLSIK